MERSEQESLKVRLYSLTLMFTKAYKPKYYYQYRGDIEDLAADIYAEFLTPKGSKGKEKKTLLDKFDPSVTSIEYLTKICVVRKLIDRSRQDPIRYVSIDNLLAEKGDGVAKAIRLFSDDHEENNKLSARIKKKIFDKFYQMDRDDRNKVFAVAMEIDSELVSELKPVIPEIHGCLLQQVTSKSALLYVKEWRTLIAFDVNSGRARGSRIPFVLTEEDLQKIKELKGFESHLSKELFLDYCSEFVYE